MAFPGSSDVVKHLPVGYGDLWFQMSSLVASPWNSRVDRLSDFTFIFFPLAIRFKMKDIPKEREKGQKEKPPENDLGCSPSRILQPSTAYLEVPINWYALIHPVSGSCPGLVTFLLSSQTLSWVQVLPSWTPLQLCTKMLNKWGCISTLGPTFTSWRNPAQKMMNWWCFFFKNNPREGKGAMEWFNSSFITSPVEIS